MRQPVREHRLQSEQTASAGLSNLLFCLRFCCIHLIFEQLCSVRNSLARRLKAGLLRVPLYAPDGKSAVRNEFDDTVIACLKDIKTFGDAAACLMMVAVCHDLGSV